jgi:hypothetical protein
VSGEAAVVTVDALLESKEEPRILDILRKRTVKAAGLY